MIQYYMKSFLRSIRKNFFFHGINLTGFFAGIFLLTVIFTFIYQELSFDGFHSNQSSIYRIQSGGYGVTPLCFGEKIRNKIPEVKEIVRFSSKELVLKLNEKEFKIENAYYVDPEIFKVYSFRMCTGNASRSLNAPFSLVLSRSVAKQLYGDRSAVGETVRDKDGTEFTITGIMEDIPHNSHIRSNAFLSMETLRRIQGDEAFNCGSWSMNKWPGHFEYRTAVGPLSFIQTFVITASFTLMAVSFLIFHLYKTDPVKTLKQE
jgi:putative ABC transport system permease protein